MGWEAVLAYLEQHETRTRGELLERFHRDDEELLRGVLGDLVDSGLVFRSGQGDRTVFRMAPAPDVDSKAALGSELGVANLLWVVLHERGRSTASELANHLGLRRDLVDRALLSLAGEGRIAKLAPNEGGADSREEAVFEAEHCVIPFGDEHGWEAALFDHYQAMVTAIAAKVRSGATRSRHKDAVGGSTYHFDLCPGHPLEPEVLGLLGEVRTRVSELRQRVNEHQESSQTESYRVVFYAGQNLIGELSEPEGDEE